MKDALIFCVILLILPNLNSIKSQTYITDKQNVSGIWSTKGSPYFIKGEAIVPAGRSLTIEAGVEIFFYTGTISDYLEKGFNKAFLRVNGKMIANGTQARPIKFYPKTSDGSWGVILFDNPYNESSLNNCILKGSGYIKNVANQDNATGAVSCHKGSLSVSHCIIKDSWVGINSKQKAHISVLNCNIINNQYGLEFNSEATCEVINSIIYLNKTMIYCNSSKKSVIKNSILQENITVENVDGISNIYGNPMFTDMVTFQLSANSPCRNAGKNNTDIGAVVSKSKIYAKESNDQFFYDEFYSNENDWATGSTSDYSLKVSSGKYYFEHYNTEGSWLTYKTIDINQSNNFKIETTINKVSGVQNYGYGLIWGRKDSDNQYEFLISGNGYYKIMMRSSGSDTDLKKWTLTDVIYDGYGTDNKLTIVKKGNNIDFYINDNHVFSDQFRAFMGDKIGWVIYSKQKIGVDNLKVDYLTTKKSGSAPVISISAPDISRGFRVVQTKKVHVEGRATDADGIYEILVNGMEANLRSGGYFSIEVPLAIGDNNITVKATDTRMNSSEKKFNISREQATVNNDNNFSEKRVALILGNSNYYGAANLGLNPINDAQDMAATLQTLGFNVIIRTDANLNDMNNAIREFARKNRDADVALFYFAGHGMQVERVNYLLPVGVNIKAKTDVEFECVSVNTVQNIMETSNSNRLNLIILDACRNNPFRTWQRGGETGLADMTPPSGTLIAFSTSPGSTAANGNARNGLYTGELVKQLKIPQRIEDVFINTRIEVENKSGGNQSPWELARLRGVYYLKK